MQGGGVCVCGGGGREREREGEREREREREGRYSHISKHTSERKYVKKGFLLSLSAIRCGKLFTLAFVVAN